MRLSITQLRIRALRSIKESALDLPEKGLLLIQGKNKDTGGSSGAGKSNLFQAIAFALGFSDYTGPELQSWFWDEAPEVELALTTIRGPDSSIQRLASTIVRGPKSKVLTLAGHIAGAKEVAAEIQRLCGGLKPEMVRALTYMRQDEQDSFLSLTSGQKFNFLTTLLPEITLLEKVGSKAEKGATQAEALLTELAKTLLQVRDTRASQVATLEAARPISQVEQAQAELLARTEELEAKLEASRATYREVIVRRDARRVELEKNRTEELRPLERELEQAQFRMGSAQASATAEPTPEMRAIEAKQPGAQLMLEKALAQDETRRRSMDEEREKLRQSYRDLDQEVNRLNVLASQLPKITADRAKLEQNVCSTCGQTWEAAKQEAANLVFAIDKISKDLLVLPDVISRRSAVRAAGEALPKWAPSPTIERIKGIQAQLKQRLAELGSAALSAALVTRSEAIRLAEAELEAIRQQIRDAKDRYVTLAVTANEEWATFDLGAVSKMAQELETMRKQAPTFDRQLAELRTMERVGKENLARLDEREAQVQVEVKAAQEDLKMHAGIAEVLSKRGFLSAIFQEVLDEISAETNGILAQVANTAEITVGFVTESETKSDTILREIKAVSTVRGHMTSLKAGCSGGMLAAVRLAIQLAVRRVVSRRMGVFPGWLILDEPFNGLGEVEKMTCMEILKGVAAEDLVMVVDHATEFQELFDRVVVVTMERGVSAITEAA